MQRLETSITKAHTQFKVYGVQKNDIRMLAYNNLGLTPEIIENFT
jgi:hypothetical protein